jgi:hypothetical protein
MALQRPHYFNNQFLMVPDFTAEQQYHIDARWRLTRLLHTPGIVSGLDVVRNDDQSVVVKKGAAIDDLGREIILDADSPPISLSNATLFPANSPVVIAVRYADDQTVPAAYGDKTATRLTESPKVDALNTDPTDGGVVLGRFQMDANRKVPDAAAPNFLNAADRKPAMPIIPAGSIGRDSLDRDIVKKIDTPPIGAKSISVTNLADDVMAKMTPPGPDLQAGQQRHMQLLHKPGVIRGLDVTAATGTMAVNITGGEAIDSQGRELVLIGSISLDTPAPYWSMGSSTYYIVIDGKQTPYVVTDAPTDLNVIILAVATASSMPSPIDGAPPISVVTVDTTTRQWAGAVLAKGAVAAIHLSSDVHAMLASPPVQSIAESHIAPALMAKIGPPAFAAVAARHEHLTSLLHTPGVAEGLTVVVTGSTSLTVNPGTAIDKAGREIVLTSPVAITNLDLERRAVETPLFVTIAYLKDRAPDVQVTRTQPPTDGSIVVLASFNTVFERVAAKTGSMWVGKIPVAVGGLLEDGRQLAGAKLSRDIAIPGRITTPMWKVTQLFNDHPGPLPLAIDQFSTSGGTLLIFASGSGWGGGETNIGMDIYIDGVLRGKAGAYANLGGKHMTFSANALVVTGLLASQKHNLDLEPWTGTTSDGNDHYTVTVLELPF